MMRFRHTVFIVFILVFIDISGVLPGHAYYFGRNKIQYTDFNWQVMETEHFDIYFYPEMLDVAEKGAFFAEEAYAFLETKFNYSVNRRIPLIFYSTHLHFEQTNITPGFIPEGVGGFFEFIKGRVVIPSNGDIKRFRRVIRHELVHVFMHGKISNTHRLHGDIDGVYPPLWFVEGLAEFWSGDWDAKGEMILKDAVLNNYIVGLQNIHYIMGTFTMYKVGQDVMYYIAKNFGEDKILALMENLWKHHDFKHVFAETIGLNFREFDQQYLHSLKKRYYPLMADQNYNSVVSETIVAEGYNFKPCYYQEDGVDYVVFVGNRTGYTSLFMKPLRPLRLGEKEDVEVLLKGEASSDYESFHIFDSKIDVHENGLLTFSSKSGETDALYIYDIPGRSVKVKQYFKDIVGISSPSWSPDGKRIVFGGLSISGFKDLYIFDVQAEMLTRLTNDFYNDLDPVFSPDGRYIAFSSDRTNYGREGASNLFLLDLQTRDLLYLTYGNQQDITPVFSPDGTYLAYASQRAGTFNIYMIDDPVKSANEHRPLNVRQMTNFVGTTFDPEWQPDGSLLFGTFENGAFQIRREQNIQQAFEISPMVTSSILPASATKWRYKNIEPGAIRKKSPYARKYQLDFASSQFSQDPVFGSAGGAQFVFTDVLGNDQYYLLVYNNARTTSDFWKSFNIGLSKVSLGKRFNYSYGIFRLAGYYYNPQDFYYYEERLGGNFTVSYPLSQFSRFSFSQNLTYSDKSWVYDKSRIAYLNSSYVSFVHDNSMWMGTGPLDGHRLNITLGNTYDFAYSNVNYLTAMVDYRKYTRISLRSAYAVRLFTMINEGREARYFYMGGSWDMRLYRRLSLYGQRLFLVSQEIRFPLIDMLGIRLPFGAIGFNGIRGAVFVDAGNAWTNRFPGFIGSYGVGLRMRFAGYLVLRLDIGRRTDFKSLSGQTISQFFFGWDF